MHKARALLASLVLIALALVALRAIAPVFVKREVNEALAGMEGYDARIVDVDLALWRGAYRIEGLVIEKVRGKRAVPFADVPVIDLSMSWNALLFERALVGEMVLHRPVLSFVGGKGSEAASEKQLGPKNEDWHARVERLFPFRINRIELHDGTLRYRDPSARPKQDLLVNRLDGSVENITNALDLDDALPARLLVTGEAFDTGAVRVRADFDPWAGQPAFNLDLAVRRAPLTAFNGFSDEYGAFDFESGQLSLFLEIAAAEGRFEGYVKPLLKDVEINDPPQKDPHEPWWRKAWEAVVGGASEVVENQPQEQVGTKIPIAGRFDDPEAGALAATVELLKNAFVRALRPGVDDEVDEADAARIQRGGHVGDVADGLFDKLFDDGGARDRRGERERAP